MCLLVSYAHVHSMWGVIYSVDISKVVSSVYVCAIVFIHVSAGVIYTYMDKVRVKR